MPLLNWLNDDEARKASGQVPYRLLEADPAHSEGLTHSLGIFYCEKRFNLLLKM